MGGRVHRVEGLPLAQGAHRLPLVCQSLCNKVDGAGPRQRRLWLCEVERHAVGHAPTYSPIPWPILYQRSWGLTSRTGVLMSFAVELRGHDIGDGLWWLEVMLGVESIPDRQSVPMMAGGHVQVEVETSRTRILMSLLWSWETCFDYEMFIILCMFNCVYITIFLCVCILLTISK